MHAPEHLDGRAFTDIGVGLAIYSPGNIARVGFT
jgi:hypothetical protein